MKLPSYVLECLNALEAAGYPAYAVGGCVRDACLGLQPHDYDICTAAVPQQTEAVFAGKKLVLAGEKHGTVGVVTAGGVVEITTFRTEGAYRDNRHPDWVKFVDSVESDLARRDYTVNAMAYSPTRGFADPFDGRVDLESKVLRAVGDPVTRFQEDSLRILRGVRFAVKYGLSVDPATEDAMESQAQLMENLAEERVFDELCKLLPLVSAEDLCRFAPILGAVIPELQPMIGFDQHSPHHAYDLFTHTAHVTAGVSADLTQRWAALLHDTGKVATFTRDATGRGPDLLSVIDDRHPRHCQEECHHHLELLRRGSLVAVHPPSVVAGCRHARESVAEGLAVHLLERHHERRDLSLSGLVEPAILRRINSRFTVGATFRVVNQVAVHCRSTSVVADDVDVESA